ncbi:type II toxin-antitoxin system RelE/ParE family toxin [Pseudomonas fragi]|nr:type II toxin-antitoxin system RelE/ParE family toxin [Pseudomonas fragi]
MYLFRYTTAMTDIPLVLNVRFFCTDAGNEPVREWLTDLPREHRRMIGTDIKTVQLGWPIGMPVVRKLDTGLWEVRIDLGDTIARVLFTVVGSDMILLHGFIKKSQKTPASDMATAKQRKARL